MSFYSLQQRLPGHKNLAVVHPLRPETAAKTDVSSFLSVRRREEKETLKVVSLFTWTEASLSRLRSQPDGFRRKAADPQSRFCLICLWADPAPAPTPWSSVPAREHAWRALFQFHNEHQFCVVVLLLFYYTLITLLVFCLFLTQHVFNFWLPNYFFLLKSPRE